MESRQRVWAFVTGAIFFWAATSAYALDPGRPMSQYLRNQWTIDDGFPGGQVSSIAQTPDGYLWIGGENGLVRFDGVNFSLIREPLARVYIAHVLGLTTDREGALWVWMQGANVLRYRSGSFENVTTDSGLPDANVTAMSQGADGSVILSTLGQQIFEYKNTRVDRVGGIATPNTLILSNAATADGRIWIGTRDRGLFYLQNGRVISVAGSAAPRKINCLLQAAGNGLWVGTDEGLLYWDGSELSRLPVPDALRHRQVLTMARDRDQNLWSGTPTGLFRVAAPGNSKARVTAYQSKESVTALFEDREGNLWIGTSRGIERWQDSAFETYSSAEGLPAGSSGPLYVDAKGVTWLGPSQGGLYVLQGGRARPFKEAGVGADVVYSVAGRNADIWLGRQKGGVTHLFRRGSEFAAETFTQADGVAQNSVYVVHESPDGTVWAGTLSAGLSVLKKGVWKTYTAADGLGSNTILAIEDGPGSDVWVGTSSGLSAFRGNQWHTYSRRDGLPSDEITSLLRDNGADSNAMLWVGTADGLALLSSSGFQSFESSSELLREPVWGMASDRNGFLWIATPKHILRVGWQQLLQGSVTSADVREYGHIDGLKDTEGIRRTRSLISDRSGDVWLSTPIGLAVTEPTYMRHGTAASIVQVQQIVADGSSIDMQSARIPSSRRRIVFDYNGLSLSAPDRVRYRYRLDGFDKSWSEPTPVRQAVYTHLDPGSYRFRVLASNSDGIWNSTETSLPFVIEPAVWQTLWFRLCCLTAASLAVWGAYLIRMREIAKHHNLLFEERLAERMRIAQDLHDTLLQSFHALMLRFQAVSNMLPDRAAQAKESLDVTIDRAADAITESRDAVQKLRTSTVGSSDLVQSLTRLGQELGTGPSERENAKVATAFRVLVEGTPRQVDATVRDDLYRIAREAVRNAIRHAQASQIELDLRYGARMLRLRVRDDGIGMEPGLLALGGREGHWGLPGMRERTNSMGGQLGVWSELGQGTEIEVTIPGQVAYAKPSRRGNSRAQNGGEQ